MDKIRIGILGAARIAPSALIKPAAEQRRGRGRRGRGPRSRPRRRVRSEARHPERSRRLRRARRRPRHRRDLQPASERAARGVDDCRARGGQARPVREAIHREREGSRGRGRRRGADRPRRHGGVPLPLSPARAPHARDRRERRAGHDPAGRDRAVFPVTEVLRHPLPVRPRGRGDDGRRLLHRAPRPRPRPRRAGGRLGRRRSCAPPTSTAPCGPSCGSRAATPVGSRARCGRSGSSRPPPGSPATAARSGSINPTAPQIWHRMRVLDAIYVATGMHARGT